MLDKAQKDYESFLASQKELSYNFGSMEKEQQDTEMLKYTKLKLAAGQEQTKNSNFLTERRLAFEALDKKYQVYRDALAVEWQNKENNLV
jgi:hypothetical protein